MNYNDIQMTEKNMQNTHEKNQLEWVKNSKLFHKRDARISNLTIKINTKNLLKLKANKYIKKDFSFP